jgi:hypothetical protein
VFVIGPSSLALGARRKWKDSTRPAHEPRQRQCPWEHQRCAFWRFPYYKGVSIFKTRTFLQCLLLLCSDFAILDGKLKSSRFALKNVKFAIFDESLRKTKIVQKSENLI